MIEGRNGPIKDGDWPHSAMGAGLQGGRHVNRGAKPGPVVGAEWP